MINKAVETGQEKTTGSLTRWDPHLTERFINRLGLTCISQKSDTVVDVQLNQRSRVIATSTSPGDNSVTWLQSPRNAKPSSQCRTGPRVCRQRSTPADCGVVSSAVEIQLQTVRYHNHGSIGPVSVRSSSRALE